MKLVLALIGLLLSSVVVYLLAVWAQRQGWVNFRAAGSGMTGGVAEVGRILDPPTRHIEAAREEKPHQNEEGDPDHLARRNGYPG